MSRLTLYRYNLEPLSGNGWLLRLPPLDPCPYTRLLDESFPPGSFNWIRGQRGVNETILQNPSIEFIESLKRFLEKLKELVWLGINKNIEGHFTNELDWCFALDYNNESPDKYTPIGDLEKRAKYDRDAPAQDELILRLTDFCNTYIPYRDAYCIVPVPPNPGKTFHLPDVLVNGLRINLRKPFDLKLRKQIETSPFKDIPVTEKLKLLSKPGDIFRMDYDLRGNSIIVVDDLYQSGATMWSVAKFLKQKGAGRVFGLACVKSWGDSDNL